MRNLITFLKKNPYRKEISLVIALKLVGLFLLWALFFSNIHPITNDVMHFFR